MDRMDRRTYGGAYRGARVLVTGGAGFIGSHLAEALAALGAEVRVLDDLSGGRRANVPDDVDLRAASVTDEATVQSAVEGCRFVFHQAAMVSVPLSVERPVACLDVNLRGTLRVLEAARAAGVKRLVLASSAAVYGESPNLPSRETDPIDCGSPYAASKASAEALVKAYASCYDLSAVSLRYFNVFGPRQDPDSPYAAVVAAFRRALAEGRAPRVFGDGTQTRDFVPIGNVVHANLLAGACERDLRGEAVNVGLGERTSLLEMLARMQRLAGTDFAPAHAPERAGDVPHSGASIELAREMLGYQPVVTFAEGLAGLL